MPFGKKDFYEIRVRVYVWVGYPGEWQSKGR